MSNRVTRQEATDGVIEQKTCLLKRRESRLIEEPVATEFAQHDGPDRNPLAARVVEIFGWVLAWTLADHEAAQREGHPFGGYRKGVPRVLFTAAA
jgi:hypothetical protein